MVNRLLAQRKILGIGFLALLLLSVWLTYAIFTKKFTEYERVTLETPTAGLQLPERGDVKIRGVIIGEVLELQANAERAEAEVTLGLFPERLEEMQIPSNVTASIIPKTLFGQKYVSLEIPENPSTEEIRAGDVITRTEVSTEVGEVLEDLYPLLRTVQPGELNMTLNALATALEGRGEQIGENLERLDSYLKRLNPEIPQFLDNLRKTAEVSDTYSDVLPEVAQILDNTVTTMQTLETKEQQLTALFRNVTAFSNSARTFLADNEENLIRLGELSAEQLQTFARYSPEFPCLLGGLVNGSELQAEAYRNFKLHIVLELIPPESQPRPYQPRDKPRYGDNRGPNCLNLPSPPGSQANPFQKTPNFDDGVDNGTGKGTTRVAPGPAVSRMGGMAYAGSEVEAKVYRHLLAPTLGIEPDQVGDLGPLLVGPMARGAEVSMR